MGLTGTSRDGSVDGEIFWRFLDDEIFSSGVIWRFSDFRFCDYPVTNLPDVLSILTVFFSMISSNVGDSENPGPRSLLLVPTFCTGTYAPIGVEFGSILYIS